MDAAAAESPIAQGRPQVGNVQSVHIYPVEGCAAVDLDRPHPFDDNGLQHDRSWRVVDAATGSALSQCDLPQLALIRVALVRDQDQDAILGIELSCAGCDSMAGVSVGVAAGQSVDDWLSAQLGQLCRLERRPVGGAPAGFAVLSTVFIETVQVSGNAVGV